MSTRSQKIPLHFPLCFKISGQIKTYNFSYSFSDNTFVFCVEPNLKNDDFHSHKVSNPSKINLSGILLSRFITLPH